MVRVVLSNVYGTAPLTIGAAHIALRDKDLSIETASGRFCRKFSFEAICGMISPPDPR